MWGNDANDRAIPNIPAQRTSAEVPACCGKPMTRGGGQWVCRKCGGSYEPPEGKATALHKTDADRDAARSAHEARSLNPPQPEAGPRPQASARAEQSHREAARVSRFRRAARLLTRRPSQGAQTWQCSECGRWFESDQPSQICPNCS